MAPTPEAEEAAKKFKAKHGIEYALLAGAEKTVKAYGIKGFPTMFLVGKDGKVLWSGHFEDASLHTAIGAATGAK